MNRPARPLPTIALAVLHLPGLMLPEPPAALLVGLGYFLFAAVLDALRL